MDFPRFLATYIENETGLRAQAWPARAEIAVDHFRVMIDSFWDEPSGTTSNVIEGDYSFEQDGPPVEGYDQSIAIRVIWRSNCQGEYWRAEMIAQTQKNAMFFHGVFHLVVFGGKLVGGSAGMMDDGQGVDVANIEDWNIDRAGLGFNVLLQRDPQRDRVFVPETKGKKQIRNGVIAEQHFAGSIQFKGGAIVPNDARRHV